MFLVVNVGLVCSEEADYLGEIPPIEIGGVCDVDQHQYLWTTETRTRWTLQDILVVPVAFSSVPDSWAQRDQFLSEVTSLLGNEDAEIDQFVDAADQVSRFLVEPPMKTFVLFSRDSSSRIRRIECQVDQWQLISDFTTVQADASDWIEVAEGTAIDVQSTAAKIERILEEINFQRGSDPRPRHSFQEF